MNTVVELMNFAVYLLQLMIWLIFIYVILGWLVAFNVVNTSNRFVASVLRGMDRILGPLLRPIRNLMPDMGGIDFSPMILILGIILTQRLLTGLQLDMLS